MPRTSPDQPLKTRGSMTDAVMEHVRSLIVEEDMVPGEWYSVHRLAEQLGVSRSPVREGLLRLEEIGIIRFAKNRGFQVVPTLPEDVAEIFCIRAALEVPAAGRAARAVQTGGADTEELIGRIDSLRAAMDEAAEAGDEGLFFTRDQQLHAVFMTVAGMGRAREMIDALRVSTRLLGASTSQGLRTLEDISQEHEPVIRAIFRGDEQGARSAMERHLESTGRLLVQQALDRAGGASCGSRDVDALWDRLTAGYFGGVDTDPS